jgi:hypothetical protein
LGWSLQTFPRVTSDGIKPNNSHEIYASDRKVMSLAKKWAFPEAYQLHPKMDTVRLKKWLQFADAQRKKKAIGLPQ